jgi:hypothetical protein
MLMIGAEIQVLIFWSYVVWSNTFQTDFISPHQNNAVVPFKVVS